ncbi:PSMC3 interacting protein [Polyrhizophydium stewartii]|uniref:Homologous-pairing protein 2 homolog n=1 Tax=Polyrhizophydium stewartii TaxID=2732419 RepID=A0ABR4N9H8_9FUNG
MTAAKPAPADAQDLVLLYLRKQNRPYNANDIFSNMRGAVAKTALAKILAACAEQSKCLSDDQLIQSKTYGKQVIFAPIQEVAPEGANEETQALSAQLEEVQAQLAAARDEATQELQNLQRSPTTEAAREMLARLTEQNGELRERLRVLSSGERLVSPEECKRILAAHARVRGEWKSRRKLFMSVWSHLSDTLPGSPKQLMETLGIETDEDVGVKLEEDA